MRKCKQCGELKHLQSFRPYDKNSPDGARYRTCMVCEKINNRYKYLSRKPTDKLTSPLKEEMETIEFLYKTLEEQGLQPPAFGRGVGRVTNVSDTVTQMIQDRKQVKEAVNKALENAGIDATNSTIISIPHLLDEWLKRDLTVTNINPTTQEPYDPEYLQDIMYEQLRLKFRPQLGVDEDMNPVYDDTYKDILNKILQKFDDYEEWYYEHVEK